jgi:hypothetical protein
MNEGPACPPWACPGNGAHLSAVPAFSRSPSPEADCPLRTRRLVVGWRSCARPLPQTPYRAMRHRGRGGCPINDISSRNRPGRHAALLRLGTHGAAGVSSVAGNQEDPVAHRHRPLMSMVAGNGMHRPRWSLVFPDRPDPGPTTETAVGRTQNAAGCPGRMQSLPDEDATRSPRPCQCLGNGRMSPDGLLPAGHPLVPSAAGTRGIPLHDAPRMPLPASVFCTLHEPMASMRDLC